MRLFYNLLRRAVLFFSSVMLLSAAAGCSSEQDVPEGGNSVTDDISVCFRIFAGETGNTRAVDEQGSAAEAYIDPENLKILIFDKEGKLKEVLYDNGAMNDVTSLDRIGHGLYYLRTKLDPSRYNLASEFAIVTLANWKGSNSAGTLVSDWKGHTIDETAVGVLTVDDLRGMTFTLNPDKENVTPTSWRPGNDSWIPMFGSRYTSLAGYDPGVFGEANPMPIPDVQLIRAFSKIEIINLDTENAPMIESIELVGRNQTGRLVQDWDFRSFTDNVTSPTLCEEEKHTGNPLRFHKEGNVYSAYMPEMNFDDFDSRKAICVNLDMNGVRHKKWIYLAPYGPDGKPMNQTNYDSDWDSVKRNYMYRYSINSLAFEFFVEVRGWQFGGMVHIPLE